MFLAAERCDPETLGWAEQQLGVRTRLLNTRSGKIPAGTMRRIADGEEYTAPATIDDPAVLDEIGTALKGHGLAP